MDYSSGEGLLRILSSLPSGRRFYAPPKDLALLIEGATLNTLVCDDSYAKAFLLEIFCSDLLSKGKVVCVIDLDTFFTAYVEDHGEHFIKLENLVVMRPKKERIDDAVAEVCSSTSKDLGLIVLDSARSFYHIASDNRVDTAALNRKLSLILTLLQKTGAEHSIPVVVTSLFTPKIGSKTEGALSKESYPGSRLLERRSRVVIQEWQRDSFLEIKVSKHPFSEGVGRSLFVKLV